MLESAFTNYIVANSRFASGEQAMQGTKNIRNKQDLPLGSITPKDGVEKHAKESYR